MSEATTAEFGHMNDAATAEFGQMLREYRLAARLTQEALAERAGMGVRSIQALERGGSKPLRDTLQRLMAALRLDEADRRQFLAAATPAPRRRAGRPVALADPSVARAKPPTNLPLALTSFVGREREIAEVRRLLANTRLLTLTGTGGVGKTRLALAVAAALVDQYPAEYPDGVWLVELAVLTEERLVAQSVLEALGTREEPGRPLLATLTDYLHEKRLLLVLDNCEHLVAACAALAEAVVRRCPGVRVLATSREGLAVAGEHRYRVPSLAVPDLAQLPPPERLAEAVAVALFVARAQERRPDFALTAQNARALAQVCVRLDGIPLAIELAAARVESLGVEGIAARLDDRFRLLTGGPRAALPRQHTLRAALDWSYALLTATERRLLDRLCVFMGGWTLAATEAICAGEGVEAWEILDLLESLVNKSLVQTAEAGGEVRYGLLETVRQYGQERLAAAGGAEDLRDRHLAWYRPLAEGAAPRLWSAEEARYDDQLEREHDNVRAALRWARERGAAEEGLLLAAAMGHFWLTRSYLGEGRRWLEGALAVGARGSDAARAQALTMAGHLASWQGDFEDAVGRLEQGVSLFRALGDTSGLALGLSLLGEAVERQGDYARATLLQEESLALRRALGQPVGIASALDELAWVAYVRGAYERAVALCEESGALWRDVGNPAGLAYALTNLASVLERRGAYARAAAVQEEALALCRGAGNPAGIAAAQSNLGWTLLAQGEDQRATAHLEASLALAREVGLYRGVPDALTYLGWAAYGSGEYERASALLEQALTCYRHIGYRWGIARLLAALGCVVQAQDAYARAATHLRESLQISHALGARGVLAEALETIAWLAEATGQAARAARLGGAAEALREVLGAPLHRLLRAGHERAVQAMRDTLDEAEFAAAWATGRALPLEEAVALALGSDTASNAVAARERRGLVT